ncbi:MAG: selenocysteine-specific translation elongation factor [Chloroflexi bacterium]|jgi:selenocysteine-specific elongation factor|nr:selenocysteine-specific translation elongation factor [Chloroflexota bacterium]
MSVVVGTAGHIDHGKTTLLHALTGIDADRLPEERRRGMTIDVGYAHLALLDGDVLDFVDVPGHDRLVGNMLVGAGEVDAAMLVVAADDGPRAQTIEHLALLDALGITDAIVVITKADLVPPDDPRRGILVEDVAALLAPTGLAGSPVLVASAATGEGIDDLRTALLDLRDRVRAGPGWAAARSGAARLAVDRSFTIRGRGRVVTGTLRGTGVAPGDRLRLLPRGGVVRVREVQVRGTTVPVAADGGRVALNVTGDAAGSIVRGDVLLGEPVGSPAEDAEPVGAGGRSPGALAGSAAAPVGTRRLIVAVRPQSARSAAAPVRTAGAAAGRPSAGRPAADLGADGATYRLSLGTAQADATIRRSRGDGTTADGTLITRLHLAHPVAAATGDRFTLRRPSPAATAGGGIVLDPSPPTGPSRRHAAPDAASALLDAVIAGDATARDRALLDLHGALPAEQVRATAGARRAGPLRLSAAVAVLLGAEAVAAVAEHHAARPEAPGAPLADLRRLVSRTLRRRATVAPEQADAAAAAFVDGLVASGTLARDGDAVRDPARAPGPPPALAAAMDRLEAALATPAPPAFADAVRAAGCPPEGVRALEQSGRIVRLEADLAFAMSSYRELAATALAMARRGPLTPAAFRDATGSSRRYALAILEDLDRRQILRRTPDGHVPGPRAPAPGPRPDGPAAPAGRSAS